MNTSYYQRNKERLLENARQKYIRNKEYIKDRVKERRSNETNEARKKG